MPPHHHEYINYPTPDHDQLARLLGDPANGIDGDEWASIVERVLEHAPPEQRAIADMIVSLHEKVIATVEQLVAALPDDDECDNDTSDGDIHDDEPWESV